MSELIGLYLHIPFCISKCPYCDFYSLPVRADLADQYTEKLCLALKHHPYGPLRADTLYFGGGTPSLLGPGRLGRLLEAAADSFGLHPADEITLEANPATVTLEDLRALRKAGFTRVSFGVQSLRDGELKALGRRHSAKEAKQSLLDASAAGFERISADLMLGIPGQTAESLARTMEEFCALPADHISAYLLRIEAGTPFGQNNAAALCPDEDAAADFYLQAVELLARQGFFQYEISNFAKPGGQSRHNLKYWQSKPYLGLGPGAHSFLNGRRFYFPRDLQAFLEAADPWDLAEDDGAGGGWEEYAMLRLRLAQGLDLHEAARLHGADADLILARAAPLERQGLLTAKQGVIALTPRGFLLSNSVTAALLYG